MEVCCIVLMKLMKVVEKQCKPFFSLYCDIFVRYVKHVWEREEDLVAVPTESKSKPRYISSFSHKIIQIVEMERKKSSITLVMRALCVSLN